MKEIERFKQEVLKEYPRLNLDDTFSFNCHNKIECFNQCCRDVNIFLTPYDVLRLKNCLGISSEEFLAKYTLMPADDKLQYPVIMLKLMDTEEKQCHFVDEERGCTVYGDRPWACRMYPLGLASPSDSNAEVEKEFYFVLKEDVCKGHNEDNVFKISEWITDQGIEKYDEFGRMFKELTLHEYFQNGWALPPERMDMFFMGCYNIDKFRRFVFESTFLNRFQVDDETIKKIKTDDEEMLKFSFNWLKFALYGDKTANVTAKQ